MQDTESRGHEVESRQWRDSPVALANSEIKLGTQKSAIESDESKL